eukprot:4315986-Alexandrium_andersonii.AAC.1
MQVGAWECSRHAVSTQIRSAQPRARAIGTLVLGTKGACADHARALPTETHAPNMLRARYCMA